MAGDTTHLFQQIHHDLEYLTDSEALEALESQLVAQPVELREWIQRPIGAGITEAGLLYTPDQRSRAERVVRMLAELEVPYLAQ